MRADLSRHRPEGPTDRDGARKRVPEKLGAALPLHLHRPTSSDEKSILENFSFRGAHHTLYGGPEITSVPRLGWRILKRRKEVFRNQPEGIVLVHGDTLSTLLGALTGRAPTLKRCPIEPVLRFYNCLHPFAQEPPGS